MKITFGMVPKDCDKETIKSEFYKFGECSVAFKVIPIKETHTVVSFLNEKNAQKAFEKLNNSILCDAKLNLALSESKFKSLKVKDGISKPSQKLSKKVNSDIEITIPIRPIIFEFATNSALTPTGSYYSPCFPEVYQHQTDSPSNIMKNYETGHDESPLSVIRLPVVNNIWNGGGFVDFIGGDKGNYECNEGRCNKRMDGKVNRKSEKKKIKKGNKKAGDVFVCAVCGRMIKRNSVGAHNKTRVHLMNVKMVKE